MISLPQLKTCIASYPDAPPRTTALEQRIRIGTGFHRKWYRSQKEHMLGWMVVQECQARRTGKDPADIDAKGMWNRLKCSPAMFWLGECAGVSEQILANAERVAAEAADINPMDGDPHGKMMRSVLSWDVIADAIRLNPPQVSDETAKADARQAFDRLTQRNSSYRALREWLE
jgi:hypothetical protein